MLHKRVTPTERVYQKVVEPSLGSFQAIPHTSHCCVRYQHALVVPKAPPSLVVSKADRTGTGHSRAATEPLETGTLLPKLQLGTRMTRSAVEMGHMIPLYQPGKEDATNLQRSATPNTFNSTTRLKQVPLPQVKSHELVRSATPRGMKNVSISGDRYLGTAKSQPQQAARSYPQYEAPSLPKKEQVRRFEDEQSNLFVTRTMKRKSEIMSHRVDRMYYLCGSGLTAQGRYEVDEAELQRLREFSRVKNNSRTNSGRSSARSKSSFTESSIISEIRGKKSPLGSPLGSPRHTPVSRDETIDLSVQGSSMGQNGGEVKGHSGSDSDQVGGNTGIQSGRTSSTEREQKDVDEVDGARKEPHENEKGDSDSETRDSDKQETSPHRTEVEANSKRDGAETNDGQNLGTEHDQKTDQDWVSGECDRGGDGDGENTLNGNERTTDSGGEGGRRMKDGDKNANNEGDGEGEGEHSRQRRDDSKGGASSSDAFQGDGEGDGENVDGSHGGKGGGGGGDGGDGGEGQNNMDDSHAGEGGEDSDVDGGDGDGQKATTQDEACGEEKNEEGEGGVGGGAEPTAAGHTNSRLVESIAPGLNLDKTAFTMKKSDVYLTEFGNPKHAHIRTESGQESEIAQMEQKLQKVNYLTQEVDHVGHMTQSECYPSEFDNDNISQGERSYDCGVFAREKSDEDRMKAEQLKRERREAKSAAKAEQEEARMTRQRAESAWAKKQHDRVKFKMEDVYNFISSRQKGIFSQKFRELDADGNGKISVKELTKKMHKHVPKEDIRDLHKVFDLNKDKTIDEKEFVTVAALNDKLRGQEVMSEAAPLELNLNRLSLHITAYKEMFDVVDQNGDGRLSMEEIMLIVSLSMGLDVGTDKEVVRHIHATIDKDVNGSIDFIEFLSFIPFFLNIHQQIIGKPVTIAEIDEARKAVKKAMRR